MPKKIDLFDQLKNIQKWLQTLNRLCNREANLLFPISLTSVSIINEIVTYRAQIVESERLGDIVDDGLHGDHLE